MPDLFQFEWPVDQAGYELQQPGISFQTNPQLTDPIIRARGGPPRYYRPLEEHPGLWRRFANTCSSIDGVRAFVSEFGLLGEGLEVVYPRFRGGTEENPRYILSTAELIRQIAARLDEGDRGAAAELFTKQASPSLTAGLIWPEGKAAPEFKLVPRTLRSALLIQAGEAIAGDLKFRQCRNEGCPEWFRVGQGAKTARREFCSDRCRVAWARHQKRKGGRPHD